MQNKKTQNTNKQHQIIISSTIFFIPLPLPLFILRIFSFIYFSLITKTKNQYFFPYFTVYLLIESINQSSNIWSFFGRGVSNKTTTNRI